MLPVHQTVQQRQENFVAGRYVLFNNSDLNMYNLLDVPIVVVHNGHSHFTPAKPLHTPDIVAMRNHQVYHAASTLRYMLRRTVTSHLNDVQCEAWHRMNDAVKDSMQAFAPADIMMRREYDGGVIEQLTTLQPPRPPKMNVPPVAQTQMPQTQSGGQTRQEKQVPSVTTPSATTQASTSTTTTSNTSATEQTTSRKKPPKMYPCTQCDMVFKRSDHLRQHIASIHGTEKFQCPHCPRKLTYKRGLQAHIALQHQVKEPTHTCLERDCTYATNTKGLFEHHMSSKHRNERFECNRCGKECVSKYAVYEHQKRVKNCAETVKWHCPKASCGAKCRSERTQRQHVRQHHKELLAELDEQSDDDTTATSKEPRQRPNIKKTKRITKKPPTGQQKTSAKPPAASVVQEDNSSISSNNENSDDNIVPKADETPVQNVPVIVQEVTYGDSNETEAITTIHLPDLPSMPREATVAETAAALQSFYAPTDPRISELLAHVAHLTQGGPENIVDKSSEVRDTPFVDVVMQEEQDLVAEAMRLEGISQEIDDEAKRKKKEEEIAKQQLEEQQLADAAKQAGIEQEQKRKAEAQAKQEAEKKHAAEQKRKERTKARKAAEAKRKAEYQATLFTVEHVTPLTPTTSQSEPNILQHYELRTERIETTQTTKEQQRADESDRTKQIIRETRLKILRDDEALELEKAAQKQIKDAQAAAAQERQDAFQEMQKKQKREELLQHKKHIQETTKQKKSKKQKSKRSLFKRKSSTSSLDTAGQTPSNVNIPTTTSQTSQSCPTSPATSLANLTSITSFEDDDAVTSDWQPIETREKRRASSQHQEQPPAKAILLTPGQKAELGFRRSETAIITSDDVHIKRKLVEQSSPKSRKPSQPVSTATSATDTDDQLAPLPKENKSNWQRVKTMTIALKCPTCGEKFFPPNKTGKLRRHIREKHGHTEI